MNLSRKKRTKAATAGAVLLAIMLTMSACGSTTKETGANNGQSNIPTVAPTDNLPNENGIMEPGTPSTDGQDDNKATNGGDASESAKISAEGIYSGQIDSTSIEITTGDGAGAYRITEELTAVIEALPFDSKVKFEYIEKSVEDDTSIKQLWLTKIEEVK
ncbi:hypothetical protein I6N90_06505 [Paenibacillus sp. GSMTC-2017]|uniref:hypothetical protein n=1 Tax=Paenibacillus sp. GSMTC-2017 TaxID=2794350 RepID=UPI0018D5ED55|nr:hypothetical protein [Paenibacillus sp. GSMTC-2017]MBH5317465.1 hypothetical protein [Paenibacillus sp. GSMTC-2017]